MTDAQIRLPATISAGMTQKIREAFQQPIDGNPASQGMPMEYEVKHYYNYFLIQEQIGFDTFVALLDGDLRRAFPDLEFTMTWVRQCDALNSVRTARRSVAKLRAYVHERRYFTISFWDILWKLQQVCLNAQGVTHSEAGTTSQEIDALAWRYLLRESQPHIRNLRRQLKSPATTAARNAFVLVDDILAGIPIPEAVLCRNRRTHYSRGGPYKTYHSFAGGRVIPPDCVGWSHAEHQAARRQIFPRRSEDDDSRRDRFDPTAPATLERQGLAAATVQPLEAASAKHPETGFSAMADPETWSKVVQLTMRKLPHFPRTASHPG